MVPPTLPFINRRNEITLLANLLSEDATERCLFLQGKGGIGKTTLLREYQRQIVEKGLGVALINFFRGNIESPRDLLISISLELGKEKFPFLDQELDIEHQAHRSDNAGRRLVSQWCRDLSESWDSNDKPVTILIDSYECAPTRMQHWFISHFLRQARQVQTLRIVVAGRTVPDAQPSFAVLHRMDKLKMHDWLDWVKYFNDSPEPGFLETVYDLTSGNTRLMSQVLSSWKEVSIREKEGEDADRAFARQIEDEGLDQLFEAKLIVIGEPGAGKTSLAKKIVDSAYTLSKDEKTTRGIDVFPWTFVKEENKPFKVNIWDFGGQEIYHATHQFFMTRRSLYVLVADSRKEDTDFNYWLDAVELLSSNSPLIIVSNEKEDRKRAINERQLRARFTNIRGEILRVNLATNRGLSSVVDSVKYHISTLDHVGLSLPKTWVRVRDALDHDGRNFISLDEFLDLCEQNGFRTLQDKFQLSGYLHDLGVCLHFQNDALLKKTVILKPEWGTDSAYRLLDDATVKQNFGHFTQADLAKIWDESKHANMQAELLQILLNFKLCYEIPNSPGSFIAPQLLEGNKPVYSWEDKSNLVVRYTYDVFIPRGIITRFIVKMHRLIRDGELVWQSGVVLRHFSSDAEIIEYRELREIRIRVSGKFKRDLLTIVAYELDGINDSFGHLQWKKWIPCNCSDCQGSQQPYFYEWDVLHRFKADGQKIQCQHSYDMVNVEGLLDDVCSMTKVDVDEQRKNGSRIGQQEIKPNLFVSYAWGGQSEEIVELIESRFQERGVTIVRDKRKLLYKGFIKEFMELIGRARAVIVVISDKYLKSPSCMYELTEIVANGNICDRIFPIILPDAKIYESVPRVRYVQYWEEQIKELDRALKDVSAANLQGLREDIDSYTRIRNTIAKLTDTLRNMNALTPETHKNSNFEEIFASVEERLAL